MPQIVPQRMRNVALRMPPDLIEAVEAGAREAGMSNSDFHRYALRLALDRQRSDNEIAGVEERIAGELVRNGRKVTQLRDDLQHLFAYFDTFVKFCLTYTPDLPSSEMKTAAVALAQRRYKNLLAAVPQAMTQTGHKRQSE